MRNFNYFALCMGLMAMGLLALDSYPRYEVAGVVLGGFVFVASTAIVALFHYLS
jgi:hypothetical protein